MLLLKSAAKKSGFFEEEAFNDVIDAVTGSVPGPCPG